MKKWGPSQFSAEKMSARLDREQNELYRRYIDRIKQLPAAELAKWKQQDFDGWAIGSDDEKAFKDLVQTALAEVPPHYVHDIEMCRAFVADVVSSE